MNEPNKIDYDPIKSEVDKVSVKQALGSFKSFIKKLFSIYDNVDRDKTIVEINNEIEFTGISVWILICSIIVASIGLINNSPAVIIGAMLISPLMGPIRGIGYALSSNNFKVLITSLKNFGIMVGASVLASFVFYFIYPLNEVDSDTFYKDFPELFSRTNPHVLDIAIAFFGGLAGVIAASVKDKTGTLTVLPGVAIATALMPPLCTVGYGIAVWNWPIFIGSFYLFLLNSVFICLATYIVLQLLNFPKVKYVDPKVEKKVKIYVFIVLLLIVIPSIFKFYNIVQESIFVQNADNFIKSEIEIDPEIEVIAKELIFDDELSKINLSIGGKFIDEEKNKNWKLKLNNYELSGVELKINNLQSKAIDEQELLNKILVDNDKKIMSISDERDLYKSELQNILRKNNDLDELNKRILTHFPIIKSVNYGQTFKEIDGVKDTNFVFIINWKNKSIDNPKRSTVEKFINKELKAFYSNNNKVLIFNQ
ncbi:MAG: TIGR00341 family protein [Crocinitomicaceae bacterium]|nr:TIGR00341 family protein [Crocinitomicaceae bacterium]|tara:strand:+ start:10064 stop:11506 length:1443 start_codon:yes stop_codon:yes gene_type:complete